ncbi:MAG: Holliday junction branch migration protein RuvA [Bacilli bacterium]
MYAHIVGNVTAIGSNYIILENNGVGYYIYIATPSSFTLNEKYLIYVYQHISENAISLYGFKVLADKNLFLKLISVKGVGCKMALPLFSNSTSDNIINAIATEDIIYLKSFPKIGDKVARQIILDLKGKMITKEINENNKLVVALKTLGYKSNDINRILPNIKNDTIEKQIKEALKLL